MKMYQSLPGQPTGRGNLITIDIPHYAHLGKRTCVLTGAPGEDADDCTTHEHEVERDPFYWEAVEGRILAVYRKLRTRQGMTRKGARDVVWTMAFAIYMAVPAGNGMHFESTQDREFRKELEAAS